MTTDLLVITVPLVGMAPVPVATGGGTSGTTTLTGHSILKEVTSFRQPKCEQELKQMLQQLEPNSNTSSNTNNKDKQCHPNRHRHHHHKVHKPCLNSSSKPRPQWGMAILVTKLPLRPNAVQSRRLVLPSRNIVFKSSRNLQFLQYLLLSLSISKISINMSRNLQEHQLLYSNRNVLIQDCCNLNACHHRWFLCQGLGQHHLYIFLTHYNTHSWIRQTRLVQVIGGS